MGIEKELTVLAWATHVLMMQRLTWPLCNDMQICEPVHILYSAQASSHPLLISSEETVKEKYVALNSRIVSFYYKKYIKKAGVRSLCHR